MSPGRNEYNKNNMNKTDGNTSKPAIPLELFVFQGQHYSAWKERMRSKLSRKEVWDFCTEEGAKNGPLAPGAGTTDEEKKRIKRGHRLALDLLSDYLSIDLVNVHIGERTNASEVWDSLRRTFEQRNMQTTMFYRARLDNLKYSDFKDMSAYLDAFTSRVSEYQQAAGESMTATEKTMLICKNIPLEYLNLYDNLIDKD